MTAPQEDTMDTCENTTTVNEHCAASTCDDTQCECECAACMEAKNLCDCASCTARRESNAAEWIV